MFSENTATVAWAPLELSLKQETQFFFTVEVFRFGYENQVQLDSKEFSSFQLIPY